MKYKKLSRGRSGLGKWYTLWIGEGHLLLVECTGYSEEYTRYYFNDIQAVVAQRTVWGTVYNAVLALLLGGFVWGAVAGKDGGMGPVAAFIAALFLLLLILNIYLGPTCRCHVQTPVGTRPLPALERFRSVRKTLNRVHPVIALQQGEIAAPEMERLTTVAMNAPVTAPRASVAATAPPVPSEERSKSVRLHQGAFLLLLADALLSVLQALQNSAQLITLATVATLAALVFAILALARQRNQLLAPWAKRMTWGVVAAVAIGWPITYFFTVFLSIPNFKGKVPLNNDPLELFAAVQPSEHPAYAGFLLVYALVAAVISVTGLLAVRWRSDQAAGRVP